MDKVKNFCDQSMTLREMTNNLLTTGHFWPTPQPLELTGEHLLYSEPFSNKQFANLLLNRLQTTLQYLNKDYFQNKLQNGIVCMSGVFFFFETTGGEAYYALHNTKHFSHIYQPLPPHFLFASSYF